MRIILKYGKNMYVLSGIIFLVWMSFFDSNAWFSTHRELNNKIEKLQQQQKFLIEQITKDKKNLHDFQSEEVLERYARETYYLNIQDEETYIIDYEGVHEE